MLTTKEKLAHYEENKEIVPSGSLKIMIILRGPFVCNIVKNDVTYYQQSILPKVNPRFIFINGTGAFDPEHAINPSEHAQANEQVRLSKR